MAIIKNHELAIPAEKEGSKLNKFEVCYSRNETPTALPRIHVIDGKPHVAVLESSDGGEDTVYVLVVRENIDFVQELSLGMRSYTNFDVYLGFFVLDGVVYHAFGPQPDKRGW